MDSNMILSQEQQFDEVIKIILQHQGRASRAVNEEMLLMAWNVGGYVSHKLKSEEWGSKVVTQLSEYIRTKQPKLKGYSRRSVYNNGDDGDFTRWRRCCSRFLRRCFRYGRPPRVPDGGGSRAAIRRAAAFKPHFACCFSLFQI